MYDLTLSRAGINDFIAMVKKSRTSYFFLQSLAWKGHIDYYNGVVRGHSYTTSKETFPDFPTFFRHCNGFNTTSGPSRQIAVSIFEAITSQQKKLFQRFEGDLVGSHLVTDHHHNVPARIQVDDPTTGQKFAPIDGLFAVMNERHQIIAHRWTNSTTNEEHIDLAKELKLRYYER
jgi:hypothetical protein